MQQALFFFIAVLAGVLLPLQAGLNTELGRAVNSPVYAAFLSFIVGSLGLLAYCLIARDVQLADICGGVQLPWVYWTGGLMGAFYVAAIIILTPKLGVALTFGLTVAGQMVFSVVVDHYGWLGVPVHPINWVRTIGVLLIVGGVVLIRTN